MKDMTAFVTGKSDLIFTLKKNPTFYTPYTRRDGPYKETESALRILVIVGSMHLCLWICTIISFFFAVYTDARTYTHTCLCMYVSV